MLLSLRLQNRAARVLGHTSLESILESAGDVLEVSQATSANSLSSLGLLAPVVYTMSVSSAVRGKPLDLLEGRDSVGGSWSTYTFAS